MRYSKKKMNLPVLKGMKIAETFHTTEQLAISAFSLAAPTSQLISPWCQHGVSMVTAIPLFSKTQHSPVAISFPGSSRRCFWRTGLQACPSTGHRCSVKSTIRLRETTRETDRENLPVKACCHFDSFFLAFKSDWMYFTH